VPNADAEAFQEGERGPGHLGPELVAWLNAERAVHPVLDTL